MPGDERVEPIIREALKSAKACRDEYQKVAILAWPLSAMIHHRRRKLAQDTLTSASAQAGHIPNLANRSDALAHVLGVGMQLGRAVCQPLIDQLVWCAAQESSWRCARNLAWLATSMAQFDARYAEDLITTLREPWRRKALREIERA